MVRFLRGTAGGGWGLREGGKWGGGGGQGEEEFKPE